MTAKKTSQSVASMSELLASCSDYLGETLPVSHLEKLVYWHETTFQQDSEFYQTIMSTNPLQWDEAISSHRAHHHPWYDYLITTLDINNMASFLLENNDYPTFLTLLEKILDVQFIEDARAAVQENIDDEFQPEPHALLMRKLMMAVKQRADEPIFLDRYDALINRTLIFYYGYYHAPWHLVGSLFATEHMGTHRVISMKKGLQRMGLTEDELAFTTVHSECDEHHADDWLQRVIAPAIDARPELRAIIAAGIAECLNTSSVYLDYVLVRAQFRMAG